MKIAHFSWEFPPAIWGGLGTFAFEITKKQVAMGNNVTVFALNNDNQLNTQDNLHGVEVYRPYGFNITQMLHLFSNQDVLSWGQNFKFFADVIEYNLLSASNFINNLVRKNNRIYEIIDGHDWLGILGGMISKKELDIPLFFHIHSTEGGRSMGGGSQTIKDIEFQGGQTADCIITVSNAMKDELIHLGFPPEKIRVCWNGVDPDKYNPNRFSVNDIKNLRREYGITQDDIMIFFIGRLVTVKGIDKLVQAMPKILQDFPNTTLVILGVGDMDISIRNLITNLGLQNNVILRNEFVEESERILHYASADVVVLPSLYEPFGIVCTEAMSMAKPVVVGAIGTNGMREQIISSGDKQNGFHVNPQDPNDIAWGVIQLLESKETRIRMGENARNRVLKYFNWDTITGRTLEIYEEFTI